MDDKIQLTIWAFLLIILIFGSIGTSVGLYFGYTSHKREMKMIEYLSRSHTTHYWYNQMEDGGERIIKGRKK